MSAVKERIFGAVSIMNDSEAQSVWNYILSCSRSWADIEEITPDEWDIKMLQELSTDPDCHEFVSSDKAMKELGL